MFNLYCVLFLYPYRNEIVDYHIFFFLIKNWILIWIDLMLILISTCVQNVYLLLKGCTKVYVHSNLKFLLETAILLTSAAIFFSFPDYFQLFRLMVAWLFFQGILKFLSKWHLLRSNMLEGYVHGEVKYDCRLKQTFFIVDIKDNFFQICPFVLSSQAFRFRARVLLLLTKLSFSQLRIFTHQFLKTYLLRVFYLLVVTNRLSYLVSLKFYLELSAIVVVCFFTRMDCPS
jgi:hypothetical protein